MRRLFQAVENRRMSSNQNVGLESYFCTQDATFNLTWHLPPELCAPCPKLHLEIGTVFDCRLPKVLISIVQECLSVVNSQTNKRISAQDIYSTDSVLLTCAFFISVGGKWRGSIRESTVAKMT